jgi:hypothetical protein
MPSVTRAIQFPTSAVHPNTIVIPYADQTIVVLIKPVRSADTLSLIPNFEEKRSAATLIVENNCTSGVNGGFYTQDHHPLGLFEIEGERFGDAIDSNLVTGFFWRETDGRYSIDFSRPKDTVEYILQSGPLFLLPMTNPVSMVEDEAARRSFIGQDENAVIYIGVMFDEKNHFSGPLLGDVPVLLSNPSVRKLVSFTNVLNLDGGSASFFYGGDQESLVSELQSVGSLFCLREQQAN